MDDNHSESSVLSAISSGAQSHRGLQDQPPKRLLSGYLAVSFTWRNGNQCTGSVSPGSPVLHLGRGDHTRGICVLPGAVAYR